MKEKNKKIIFAIFLIIILLIIIILLSKIFDNGGISNVKKILSEKYDNIKCIDTNCNGIMSIEEKGNTSKVKLYDENGNVVASYNQAQSETETRIPFQLSKNYFLSTITDSEGNNIKYTLNNKNGKELYSTNNKLQSINDYFIVMSKEGRIGDIYTIIDSKGNEKYSDINEYESYLDGKYIYFEKEDNYFLLDEKGNKIIEDYKISEVVTDDNKKILYFILKDKKTDYYYYFNIEKASLEGDAFSSYKVNEDNSLTVTKKDTSESLSYNIDINGKKDESSITNGISDRIKEIKEKIGSDYYLYTLSIVSNKQNKVLVDNKKEKSFGIFDIKTEEYINLYSYNSDKYYSSLSILDSIDNHTYTQISCNSNVCESTKMIVFDLTDSKELFRLEGTDLVAQNYVQYKNGYKLVKYSYQSSNSDYKGKYVLYDNNNKELLLSNNQIIVIDSEYVIGKMGDESLILYNSNDKKILNGENNLAQKIKISNKIYYKYNSDDKIIIIDSNGKEIYSIDDINTLDYSDRNIYSIGSKTIKIYNLEKDITYTYNLLDNENLTDSLNNKLEMFEDAVFINNTKDNYFKVINYKGEIIKKVSNVSIKAITTIKKNKKAYIITQKKVKDKTKYGLYIAK